MTSPTLELFFPLPICKMIMEREVPILVSDLLFASDKGPAQLVLPAAYALATDGHRDRALAMLTEFVATFQSNGKSLLQEGAEWTLAVVLFGNLGTRAQAEAFAALCKELEVEVTIPDEGKSAIIFY